MFASAQEWTQPGRGIQLFGTGSGLDEPDARKAENIYRRRFPAFSAWNAELAPGDPASDYRFYRFTVDRFKLLDEATFGDGVFVEADVLRTQEETPRARTP